MIELMSLVGLVLAGVIYFRDCALISDCYFFTFTRMNNTLKTITIIVFPLIIHVNIRLGIQFVIAIPCFALSLVDRRQYFQVQSPWSQIFDFSITDKLFTRRGPSTQTIQPFRGNTKPLVQTNQPSRGNTDIQALLKH